MARDYCTGVPDGSARMCCRRHDEDYAAKVPRAEADRRFRRCLRRSKMPIRSMVYWVGVRLFGWWFYHQIGDRVRGFVKGRP